MPACTPLQESGKYEGFKSAASAESQIAGLQRMVEAKERELTRLGVEYSSERKRLEKVSSRARRSARGVSVVCTGVLHACGEQSHGNLGTRVHRCGKT